mmetsp:Transcript_23905/g.73622  ORF Transcript_23905/g.73622 Transcript_23905/m.73622 type:complete len:274 (+) Transcript_23905:843-1664(+)
MQRPVDVPEPGQKVRGRRGHFRDRRVVHELRELRQVRVEQVARRRRRRVRLGERISCFQEQDPAVVFLPRRRQRVEVQPAVLAAGRVVHVAAPLGRKAKPHALEDAGVVVVVPLHLQVGRARHAPRRAVRGNHQPRRKVHFFFAALFFDDDDDALPFSSRRPQQLRHVAFFRVVRDDDEGFVVRIVVKIEEVRVPGEGDVRVVAQELVENCGQLVAGQHLSLQRPIGVFAKHALVRTGARRPVHARRDARRLGLDGGQTEFAQRNLPARADAD